MSKEMRVLYESQKKKIEREEKGEEKRRAGAKHEATEMNKKEKS